MLVMAASSAGLVLGTTSPAHAAACSGATGVTAVVDFNELGGGVTAGCDPDGHGQSASRVFADAGYTLIADPRSAGFVCQVNGKPAAGAECNENDAYWSLWWSDGKSGEWVYSQQGAAGLRLRDGYYVAWSWHEGPGRAATPDVNPTPHQDTEPTAKPSDRPSKGGDGPPQKDPGGPGKNNTSVPTTPPTSTAPADAAPSPTATTAPGDPETQKRDKDKDRKTKRDRGEPVAPVPSDSALPEASEITAGPEAVDDTIDNEGKSPIPTIAGVVVGVGILSAAAAVPLLRRRRTP